LTKFDEFDCALKLLATGVVLMKRYLPLIIAGAAALTALASGRLLCQTIQPHRLTLAADETTSANNLAKSAHIRGNLEAAVTLEEFGDFECPNCAALATFLDQLIREYDPRVRLIFRNFPLPMHQFARDAALTAEAAGLQGRYWEMHDMLFREQAVWSSATDPGLLFDTYAEMLGLDLNQFRKDVKGDKVRERLESDQARARSLSVKTAPTLFVDKREMGPNDRTPEGVRRLVDEAVTAKTSPPEKK
jgi:protein-disulfide isomerase